MSFVAIILKRRLRGPQRRSLLGFTLLEIMVSIGIFAVMTGAVVVRFNQANRRARIAKARADIEQLKTAVEILYQDTGQHPAHLSLSPCVQDPEVYLNLCSAGLLCTDGAFPTWAGPYMTNIPPDPWNRQYRFDPDYTCNGQPGCEGIPNGTVLRALHSFGQDGVQYTVDDVAAVLCR